MSEKKIFTLEQVARSIKKTLEERYQSTYWVKAEMHKLNRFPSGHAFPELVQKDGQRIVAQMSGTLWKQQLESINRKFVEVVKEPLKEGTQLLLLVKVVFSENFGLSLLILDIDPSFSLGELQRQREETLKKLAEKGLINKNQQLKFPILPKRIAVISAEASKGLSDFMQVLDDQNNYLFFTMLFPAYLQGDVAVNSIIAALRKIEKVKSHFDVVVIVRGGGAEVGMTCYNHYDLCATIADFPLPVLTGIGHSTNLTVAEMVAYHNAITPSKLATLLVDSFAEFERDLLQMSKQISSTSKKVLSMQQRDLNFKTSFISQQGRMTIKLFRQNLENVKKNLTMQSFLFQQDEKRDVEEFSKLIVQQTNKFLAFQQNILNQRTTLLSTNFRQQIQSEKASLKQTNREFKLFSKSILQKRIDALQQLENQTKLLHPDQVLKRGYAIVRYKNQSISLNNQPEINDELEIETLQLSLSAKVQKKLIKK